MPGRYHHLFYYPQEGTLLSLLASTFAVLAFGTWLYDIAFYLRTGTFHMMNTLAAMRHLGLATSWTYAPQSWLGFHKFLAYAPLSYTLLFAGLLIAAYDYYNN